MDSIQDQHERAVGEQFIACYNANHGTHYQFDRRGGDAPDLIYRDGTQEMALEITDAYYDSADASVRWQQARLKSGAPNGWSWFKGGSIDRALAEEIGRRIEAKARCAYGANCTLLVNVSPALTTASELEPFISEIAIPSSHSFAAIYLAGRFPCSIDDPGGYRCWQLA